MIISKIIYSIFLSKCIVRRWSADDEKVERRPGSSPDRRDHMPIHSLLTILFSADMAERDARYDVFGLSGEGML